MSALNKARALAPPEESAVSLIKVIVIAFALIISILFLGRFLF
jgi:hypothetical protein